MTKRVVDTNETASTLRNPGRRNLLKLGATGALFAASKALLPGGAFAQGTGPEVKGTRLGYIALTDAAPLVIAKEKGFFSKYGLPDMDIAKQASWAPRGTTWRSAPRPMASMAGISCGPRCISMPPAR